MMESTVGKLAIDGGTQYGQKANHRARCIEEEELQALLEDPAKKTAGQGNG